MGMKGIWKTAVSKAKGFGTSIKSNLATGDNVANATQQAARRAKNRRTPIDEETMGKIGEVFNTNKKVQSSLDELGKYKKTMADLGVDVTDEQSMNAIRAIAGYGSVEDAVSANRGAFDFISDTDMDAFKKVIKESGVDDNISSIGKQKMKIGDEEITIGDALNRSKGISDEERKALDSVISDNYYSDEVSKLKNAKNAEYDKRVEAYRNSGVDFSKQDLKAELDADPRFKLDNPYDDIRVKHKSALDDIEKSRNESITGMNKASLSDSEKIDMGKKIESEFAKKVEAEKLRYGTQSDEVFKQHGFRDGSRQGAFAEALGGGIGGQANAQARRGASYFWQDANTAQKVTRIGTATAGTLGVGVAGRYLSGGNMSYNADGEKDIAGIPFL